MHASQFIWVRELHGIWNCIYRSPIKQSVLILILGSADIFSLDYKIQIRFCLKFIYLFIIFSAHMHITVEYSNYTSVQDFIQMCVRVFIHKIILKWQMKTLKITNLMLEMGVNKVVFNFIGHGLLKIKWCVELYYAWQHVNQSKIFFLFRKGCDCFQRLLEIEFNSN